MTGSPLVRRYFSRRACLAATIAGGLGQTACGRQTTPAPGTPSSISVPANSLARATDAVETCPSPHRANRIGIADAAVGPYRPGWPCSTHHRLRHRHPWPIDPRHRLTSVLARSAPVSWAQALATGDLPSGEGYGAGLTYASGSCPMAER